MANANLNFAPKPKIVDGLFAVPIDIQTIDAKLVFNGAAGGSAQGDATIQYVMGPQNGYPVFDLRQTITAAWLDGVVIPVTDLQHHNFGGGPDADMRIIHSLQTAGSTHSLRVVYNIGLPAASTAGSYQPHVAWSAGPRLLFNFGFTDLGASRYLESFVPANLIYDEVQLQLEIVIQNTAIAHEIITNGTWALINPNHWKISFPARFTALSPMLEIRSANTLTKLFSSVTLPVSGVNVAIEVWKLASGTTNLATEINNIKSFLIDNENNIGSYIHGNRFTVFFTADAGGGGMEYEGAATVTSSSLRHETYHSWWARGVKPARQQDGWWDEAWDSYHDGGGGAVPFNFTNPPVTLCSQNEWQRITAGNAYTDGKNFWQGMAALIGSATLNTLMKEFYNTYKGKLATTYDFETFLLCKTGNVQIVNAFARFVYGFNTPSPAPDLWLKDNAAHTGTDVSTGNFWNSPDLWIRNTDDDGTTHQNPEYGQDNWFYARVRNRSATVTARHFVVTFGVKPFAGTQFVYPSDFLPCIAAVVAFDLGPGTTTIVKAKWPKALVPLPGTHACWTSSVLTPGDFPVAGKHVWEHNNLAQKNLTIVNLVAGDFIIIPFVATHFLSNSSANYVLEQKINGIDLKPITSILKYKPALANVPVNDTGKNSNPDVHIANDSKQNKDADELATRLLTNRNPELIKQLFPFHEELPLALNRQLKLKLGQQEQEHLGWKIKVPTDAKKQSIIQLDLLQRNADTNTITGGISVEIRIV